MRTFEEEVETAVAPGPDRVASGVTLMCGTKQGLVYNKTFGTKDVSDNSPPLSPDAVAPIASCSKLITSIAVLQCVERGLVTLDEDVLKIYPALSDIKVFRGYNDDTDEPIFEERTGVITLRKLLTHTSGFSYFFISPELMRYFNGKGWNVFKMFGDIDKMCSVLIFQPGEENKWCYGTGIDLAGKIVEVINGGIRLGDYCQKNMFDALGINDLVYRFADRQDLIPRLMPEALRKPDGVLHVKPVDTNDPKDDWGGGGLHGSAPDYFKFLMAVFNEDGHLLKPSTWKMIYEPQLVQDPNTSVGPMTIHMAIQEFSSNAPVPAKFTWAHGLVCSIFQSDVPGWMRRGTLHWGGMRNATWFIDHESEIVTFLFTHILPFEDPPIVKIKSLFHTEMLKRFAKKKTTIEQGKI